MKNKLKAIKLTVSMAIVSMFAPVFAYADDPADDIEGAISKFGTLFGTIISAIGGVIFIWQVVNLALAIKRRDPSSTSEAMIGVAAGLIIIFAPQIVSYILG